MPIEQFFSHIMSRTSYFRWSDVTFDCCCFVWFYVSLAWLGSERWSNSTI